jgi:hypothetical protein
MLDSGKKIPALRDKKIYILTLVLILNETKNHNPPCKLNGRSLSWVFAIGLETLLNIQTSLLFEQKVKHYLHKMYNIEMSNLIVITSHYYLIYAIVSGT